MGPCRILVVAIVAACNYPGSGPLGGVDTGGDVYQNTAYSSDGLLGGTRVARCSLEAEVSNEEWLGVGTGRWPAGMNAVQNLTNTTDLAALEPHRPLNCSRDFDSTLKFFIHTGSFEGMTQSISDDAGDPISWGGNAAEWQNIIADFQAEWAELHIPLVVEFYFPSDKGYGSEQVEFWKGTGYDGLYDHAVAMEDATGLAVNEIFAADSVGRGELALATSAASCDIAFGREDLDGLVLSHPYTESTIDKTESMSMELGSSTAHVLVHEVLHCANMDHPADEHLAPSADAYLWMVLAADDAVAEWTAVHLAGSAMKAQWLQMNRLYAKTALGWSGGPLPPEAYVTPVDRRAMQYMYGCDAYPADHTCSEQDIRLCEDGECGLDPITDPR